MSETPLLDALAKSDPDGYPVRHNERVAFLRSDGRLVEMVINKARGGNPNHGADGQFASASVVQHALKSEGLTPVVRGTSSGRGGYTTRSIQQHGYQLKKGLDGHMILAASHDSSWKEQHDRYIKALAKVGIAAEHGTEFGMGNVVHVH